jgi:hypothetical protein
MKKFSIFLATAIIFFATAFPVLATECPFGVTNDPAPGQCRLYTDKNGNDYCDYGEPAKTQVAKPVETKPVQAPAVPKTNFYLLEITLAFFLWQIVMIVLSAKKRLSPMLLRKINNYGLLLSFIVIIISSAPFLAQTAGIYRSPNLKFWSLIHADSGWVMILLSLEHTIRRWRFFLPIKKQK